MGIPYCGVWVGKSLSKLFGNPYSARFRLIVLALLLKGAYRIWEHDCGTILYCILITFELSLTS